MAKKSKKPTFDRAVSAENVKDLRDNNLQPTENVAILDNPEDHQEDYHPYFGPAITPSIAHSSVEDVKERYSDHIEQQHDFILKYGKKGYTKKEAERDIPGYPISGDDLAKLGGKSLYATRDRDGYDVNDTPVVPPDRGNSEARRPNMGGY
jgi:hypothetical protein